MNQSSIKKAEKLYNEGLLSELYELLKPFLELDDPHAFYFYARFSIEEWNESDDEYDERYVSSLEKAAKGNVAEAMYRLSSLFFSGDIVDLNTAVGRRYLDKALELNFGPAKYSVGINLHYGSNGYSKNLARSQMLLSEAVKEGVEGASEALKQLR